MKINYDESVFQSIAKKEHAPPSTVLIVYGKGRGYSFFTYAFYIVNDRSRHNRTMRYYYIRSAEARSVLDAIKSGGHLVLMESCDYTLTEVYAKCEIEKIIKEAQQEVISPEQYLSERISELEQTDHIFDAYIYDRDYWHIHLDCLSLVTLHLFGYHSEEPQPLKVRICNKCGDVFIHYDEYQSFTVSNGPPNIRLNELRSSRDNSISILPINEYSRLSLYGYDVKEDGLGSCTIVRQQYLTDLIDSGLFTKNEVLRHLAFLVRMGRKNPVQANYVLDWQRDLDYIRSYNAD